MSFEEVVALRKEMDGIKASDVFVAGVAVVAVYTECVATYIDMMSWYHGIMVSTFNVPLNKFC